MAQFRFVVDGDFVDFYDGSMHAFRVRNTTQDVDWYYETDPGINFEVDGHKYFTIPSQIEIDGVTLSANTEFDAAIAAIFPNLTGGGEGGTTLYTGDGTLGGNRKVTLNGKTLRIGDGDNDFIVIDPADDEGVSQLNSIGTAGTARVRMSVAGGVVESELKAEHVSDREANILIAANETTSTITHTADSHTFNANGVEVALFDGINGQSSIKASNPTGDGNQANFSANADATTSQFALNSAFNGAEKTLQILGQTASGTSTITHTADSHTFNAGGSEYLVLDGVNFFSRFIGTNGGNSTQLTIQGANGDVKFDLFADEDGGATVQIEGSATTNIITYTAGDHIFAVVSEFADNAAAITGGKAVGTLYRTGDALKIVHA